MRPPPQLRSKETRDHTRRRLHFQIGRSLFDLRIADEFAQPLFHFFETLRKGTCQLIQFSSRFEVTIVSVFRIRNLPEERLQFVQILLSEGDCNNIVKRSSKHLSVRTSDAV